MKFTATTEDAEKRLDKFLTEHQVASTRSQIKKMITEGQVLVNNKPAKVHQFLKTDDVVSIEQKKVELKETAPVTLIAPNILAENKNYLVIEKPVGLLVHPTDKNENGTLVHWLLEYLPGIEDVGEGKQRAGIVHRLDRDVSGVMVIAKTQKMFTELKAQFANRTVEKHYTTLVYGKVQEATGDIELPIGRNKDGQFVAHPRKKGAKFQESDRVAKTRYTVLEYVKDYTLLDVQIFTGRTHQIRAHMSAISHPILGDPIYQPKHRVFNFLQRKIRVQELPRIFLHATKLAFDDLNGNRQTFESPLPKKLETILNDFKN